MEQGNDLQSEYHEISKRLFGQKNAAKFALITMGVGIALLLLFLDVWQAGAFFIGVALLWMLYISINLSKTKKKIIEIEQSAKAQDVQLSVFDPKTLVVPIPPSDKPQAATKRHTGNKLAVIAGVLLIVGTFLPWGRVSSAFGTISQSGIDGDGKFILAFGIITLVIGLVFLGKQNRMYSWALVVIGAFSFALILFVAINLAQLALESSSYFEIHGGPGPTAIFLGSIITVIAGFIKVPVEK